MTTADIFMVSYLDYRRLGDPLPGARHISNSTTTDSVQMWFSRHHDGLDLRIRYPDTTTANATVDALVLSCPNACAATPTPPTPPPPDDPAPITTGSATLLGHRWPQSCCPSPSDPTMIGLHGVS